jgi:hypothetical protein
MRMMALRSVGTVASLAASVGALGALAILGMWKRRATVAHDEQYWTGYEDGRQDLGGGPAAPQ